MDASEGRASEPTRGLVQGAVQRAGLLAFASQHPHGKVVGSESLFHVEQQPRTASARSAPCTRALVRHFPGRGHGPRRGAIPLGACSTWNTTRRGLPLVLRCPALNHPLWSPTWLARGPGRASAACSTWNRRREGGAGPGATPSRVAVRIDRARVRCSTWNTFDRRPMLLPESFCAIGPVRCSRKLRGSPGRACSTWNRGVAAPVPVTLAPP